MFNAKNLLDQLLQTAQTITPPQPGPSSPQGSTSNSSGLFGNPTLNSVLTGAGGGLLAGLLLGNKNVRKIGGTVAAYGGAAALGALAYTAYKNWKSNQPQKTGSSSSPSSATTDPLFDALPAPEPEERSRIILSALIAAAKSDGTFDERERQMIRDQADQSMTPETSEWLHAEIRKPLDPKEIARLATTPELSAEIYLASLVIVDEQNPLEKAYLDTLGDEMNLDAGLRQSLSQQLAQASHS